MYRVFTRNWWRIENGQKIPASNARKCTLCHTNSEAMARAACKEYNDTHEPGPLSRKAEYMEI